MKQQLVPAVCPVCAHSVAAAFFDGGQQALATLGWPASAAEAQAMAVQPHDFVQCPQCTHVWNRAFSYDAIPYQNNPNRMFNKGGIWKGHLADTRDVLLAQLPASPTVIDIGCGEGHFVRALADVRGEQGRFIGFDPNATPETGRGVEFHARYFQPLQDVPEFAPDALVIRHVLEHLTDPASLVEQMAWAASRSDKPIWLFAEVPCIDRVFATGRLADFFYEHMSHFTTESFRTLMQRAGEVVQLAHGYDGEVVYALVRLQIPKALREQVRHSNAFAVAAQRSRKNIAAQLDTLSSGGQRVAIWGGTGKAAAFMHQFGADAQRFPLVVDSDPDKAGTFVPGLGQQIVYRDVLKTDPVDVVIIPTQWRARDIAAEMAREGIVAKSILIEHEGGLIDFFADEHPYR
ncbi:MULTISPECIES: class I SAM-dependent methyltransferase [unclassified Janthinobacterium]|uniref:class I SAM-dependent methyltransferase n=1 Tax=unclassified Janthinobacterium TaxID=2610881 RepID=UPI001E500AB8|nr:MULTISPECIES: class I SAM-dependent methyltransferase [unclassified Janthinobacterium]MCC7643715.1 methyltransferase domain-containing protein [Janthinobacterium sp. EB271-G4-3-1]MCC7691317.1 methyltransferase domain-containing protein [Janthinobacterium sp. EB271-G4-3-2]